MIAALGDLVRMRGMSCASNRRTSSWPKITIKCGISTIPTQDVLRTFEGLRLTLFAPGPVTAKGLSALADPDASETRKQMARGSQEHHQHTPKADDSRDYPPLYAKRLLRIYVAGVLAYLTIMQSGRVT